MARVKKKAKIVERKLGREKAWGLWWENNLIEIDPRQKSKRYMNACVHELLHHAAPQLPEYKVIEIARIITNGLWEQNFRRIMK